MLMAGLDGIAYKRHPGDPMDKNLYTLDAASLEGVGQVCYSLEEAIASLKADHTFLLAGDVFSKDFLDSYIALLSEDIKRYNMTTHPVEFDMYYSG